MGSNCQKLCITTLVVVLKSQQMFMGTFTLCSTNHVYHITAFSVPNFANHLVEPRALQDEQACFEQLQNNVVSYEHLKHGAGRPTKHSHQQQGVDVSVQRGSTVHVVIEQKPWMMGESRPQNCSSNTCPRDTFVMWRKNVKLNPASLQLTFNKESQGESKAVNTSRHQFGKSTDDQCYSKYPKEQIHRAVLPVHQLDPWTVLSVVETGMWPIHHKLFHHNAWNSTTWDKWEESRRGFREFKCADGLRGKTDQQMKQRL